MSASGDELEEAIKLLYKPFLYSIPKVAETFQQEFQEFYAKKDKGTYYTEDELLKPAAEAVKKFVGYITKDAGGSGLIQRLIMKNIRKYCEDAVGEMIFGK